MVALAFVRVIGLAVAALLGSGCLHRSCVGQARIALAQPLDVAGDTAALERAIRTCGRIQGSESGRPSPDAPSPLRELQARAAEINALRRAARDEAVHAQQTAERDERVRHAAAALKAAGLTPETLRQKKRWFYARCEAVLRAEPVLIVGELGPLDSVESWIIRTCTSHTELYAEGLVDQMARTFACDSCDIHAEVRICLVAAALACPPGFWMKAREQEIRELRPKY